MGSTKHQTGHNSGVLHCGRYYKPGSVRARLAVTGIRRMVAFCEQHGVPHELCGKTVIATEPEEIPRLHALLERGTANGLEGLQLLSAEQIPRAQELHAAGLAGIRVPQEGITDYAGVAEAMAKEIRARGGEIRFSSKVTRLRRKNSWAIDTTSGDYEADFSDYRSRRAALRSRKPDGGQPRAGEDRAVPWRILPDQARAAVPREESKSTQCPIPSFLSLGCTLRG